MTFRIPPITALSFAAALLGSCQSRFEPQKLDAFDVGKTNSVLDHQHASGQNKDLLKPLHLVSAEKPAYPAELQDAGVGGAVEVFFTVGETGKVESARVLKSSDRRLNTLALDSVRKWKFQPPVGANGPRKTDATQRILFTPGKGDNGLQDVVEGLGSHVTPFHYPKSRYQKLWADKPAYLPLLEPRPLVKTPRTLKTLKPGFPTSLYSQGGKAAFDVSFVISEDGSIEDVRTIESTHPDFNSLVERAVRDWKYEPARTAKGPVKVLWEKRFVFSSSYR
ncbi:energy transducer TonB [Luteolibacter sp. LG18]|uniref:energy transducer TonB n=1 Tax=Luteolibacter sp. LG18 TaxID=2819286 RepID=UPI002B2B57E4|nr:hypothetical protein llg_29090 [Luteolibacter sp. LG18]